MNANKALCMIVAAGSIAATTAIPLSTAVAAEPDAKSAIATREKPYEVGEKLPNIILPALGENGESVEVSLESMLSDGPVVVTFFRGSWCPYCVTELRSIEKRLEKIEKLGASVLAISPEVPAATVKLDEKLDIGFTLATDHDNVVAREFGLLFQMTDEMIEKYHEYKLDVPKSNGTETWQLPIPATYVVDTDRTIRFAFVDVNYRERADYDKVLKVLQEIQDEG